MHEVAGMNARLSHKSQAERELRKFLDTLPWPWSIEQGKKHALVIIAGKSIGVISHGRDKSKDAKQLMCAVKRRLRELEATP